MGNRVVHVRTDMTAAGAVVNDDSSGEPAQLDGSSCFMSLALARRITELERHMAKQEERQRKLEVRITGLFTDVVETMSIAMQEQEQKTLLLEDSIQKLVADRDSLEGLQTAAHIKIDKRPLSTDTTSSRPEIMHDASLTTSLEKTEGALTQSKSEITASGMALNSEFAQCMNTLSRFPLGNSRDSSCSSGEAGAAARGMRIVCSASSPDVDSNAAFEQKATETVQEPRDMHRTVIKRGTARGQACCSPSTPRVQELSPMSSSPNPGSGATHEATSVTPGAHLTWHPSPQVLTSLPASSTLLLATTTPQQMQMPRGNITLGPCRDIYTTRTIAEQTKRQNISPTPVTPRQSTRS
eukprot:TRINITY_DN16207_c0_g1_i1.p1 TRINITY_DN16207_c0_g1~~TRINITY_DN16207_c0_g1_i1.p1  ORF type:complete len:354 (-),score=45.11 TRINITY_DN16207_c0_g1_i1:217-1278(-)